MSVANIKGSDWIDTRNITTEKITAPNALLVPMVIEGGMDFERSGDIQGVNELECLNAIVRNQSLNPLLQMDLETDWTIGGNVDTNFCGDPTDGWLITKDDTSDFDISTLQYNVGISGVYELSVNWGKTSLSTRLSIRIEHYDASGNGLYEHIAEFQDGYYGTAHLYTDPCSVGDYLKVRFQYQNATGTIVMLGKQSSSAHGDTFTRINNQLTIKYAHEKYIPTE